MSNEMIMLVVLIVVFLAVLPTWPYSSEWGYGPTSGLGLLFALLIIWVIVEQRPLFSNTSADLRATVHDAGQDLQSAGRDTASAIRNTIQQ